jgi:hypothetical protein
MTIFLFMSFNAHQEYQLGASAAQATFRIYCSGGVFASLPFFFRDAPERSVPNENAPAGHFLEYMPILHCFFGICRKWYPLDKKTQPSGMFSPVPENRCCPFYSGMRMDFFDFLNSPNNPPGNFFFEIIRKPFFEH